MIRRPILFILFPCFLSLFLTSCLTKSIIKGECKTYNRHWVSDKNPITKFAEGWLGKKTLLILYEVESSQNPAGKKRWALYKIRYSFLSGTIIRPYLGTIHIGEPDKKLFRGKKRVEIYQAKDKKEYYYPVKKITSPIVYTHSESKEELRFYIPRKSKKLTKHSLIFPQGYFEEPGTLFRGLLITGAVLGDIALLPIYIIAFPFWLIGPLGTWK